MSRAGRARSERNLIGRVASCKSVVWAKTKIMTTSMSMSKIGRAHGVAGTDGESRAPATHHPGSRVDREAVSVVAFDELVGAGEVFGFHSDGVPLDRGAGFQGDDSEEDGFGQASGVVEV